MAIDQGLFNLITTGVNNTAILGFGVQLPKDWISPTNRQAWVYRNILSVPINSLNGTNALTRSTYQIDAHGYQMVDAVGLARTISYALTSVGRQILTDVDSTRLDALFRDGSSVDGYDDTARTFVRSLEFEVWYIETVPS